mmetsp:Transcript_61569/g.129951  ORF Transcript_61569/g.129951 Transcript_61569/m.129951 type:complete len:354 (+) Transcript_61569:985-2046(+)
MHDSAVVSVLPTLDVDGSFQLAEEPLHVLLCSLPLCAGAREERNVADVLHDGARRALQLSSSTALLSKCVRELVVLKGHGVGSPGARLILALVSGYDLVSDLGKVAGSLGLDGTEDLQLSPSATSNVSEDGELLELVAAAASALADFAEEHQGAPFLFNSAQEVPSTPSHEANSLLGNQQHREVVVVVIFGDIHRSGALRHDTLAVLLRPPPLQLRASQLQNEVPLEEFDLGLRDPGDLLLCLASLAQDEGCIVVGDLHRINTPVLRTLPGVTSASGSALTSAPVPAPAPALALASFSAGAAAVLASFLVFASPLARTAAVFPVLLVVLLFILLVFLLSVLLLLRSVVVAHGC